MMKKNLTLMISIAAMSLMAASCQSDSRPETGPKVTNASPSTTASPTADPSAAASPANISGPFPVNSIIGEPTPQMSPLPPDAQAVQSAIDLVHEYYDAVNGRDFRKAYELWSGKGQASSQTFEQFREGYSNTIEIEIDTSGEPGDLEGAAGSQYVTIPMLINAKTKDGREQRFWGQYILRRSMVEGAEARGQWRIHSAEFREQ